MELIPDFVLKFGISSGVEVKISSSISSSDIHGLIQFQKEYKPRSSFVVCLATKARKLTLDTGDTIQILPWNMFLEMLWQGAIL